MAARKKTSAKERLNDRLADSHARGFRDGVETAKIRIAAYVRRNVHPLPDGYGAGGGGIISLTTGTARWLADLIESEVWREPQPVSRSRR